MQQVPSIVTLYEADVICQYAIDMSWHDALLPCYVNSHPQQALGQGLQQQHQLAAASLAYPSPHPVPPLPAPPPLAAAAAMCSVH